MLKQRLLSFTALLAVFGLMGYWGILGEPTGRITLLFMILATATAVLVTLELLRMLEKIDLPGLPWAGAFFAAAVFAAQALRAADGMLFPPEYAGEPVFLFLGYQEIRSLPILCALIIIGAAYAVGPLLAFGLILFGKDRRSMLRKVVVTLGVLVLVYWLTNSMVLVFQMGGIWLFLFFALTTKAGDTGGYIAGKLTSYLPGGNHKVVPSISPAKSWEGMAGGLVLSIAVALVFAATGVVPAVNYRAALVFGVLLYFTGFAGDLTESAIKRACGVKDSGVIMPGMGGVFDVVDSFIYAAPMFVIVWPFVSKYV